MLHFGPRGKKIRWQNPLQLKLLLHKAVNGQQIYDSFMRRESIDKKQKSFRLNSDEKKLHALEDS